MNNLKAGVIGLGIGHQHAIVYEENSKCDLSTLCDLDPEKLKSVGKDFPRCILTQKSEELISDTSINLISIASYDSYHGEQVVNAINNNKHIFVEKPLCLTELEYIDIVNALNDNLNIQISSNFVLRTFPQFKTLKRRIQAGELGRIYHVEGDYNYGRLSKITQDWRGSIPFYSVTHGGGIHLIDLITWLIDLNVTEVVSNGNKISTYESQFKHNDLVSALLNFESGVTGKVTSNFGSVTPHHHALRIFGTKGTFFHSSKNSSYTFSRENSPNQSADEKPLKPTREEKSEILESFINQINYGTPAIVSKSELLDSMAVSLAIERSIHSKKWEKVDRIS